MDYSDAIKQPSPFQITGVKSGQEVNRETWALNPAFIPSEPQPRAVRLHHAEGPPVVVPLSTEPAPSKVRSSVPFKATSSPLLPISPTFSSCWLKTPSDFGRGPT